MVNDNGGRVLNKLPVGVIVAEAYRGTFSHLRDMLTMTWLPVSLWLAVNVLAGLFQTGVWLGVMNFIAVMLAWSVIGVAWHRFILLGERADGGFRFGEREWRFLMAFIVAVFVPMLPFALVLPLAAPSGGVGARVLMLAALMVWCFYYVRLSIRLPAAAVEKDLSLRGALAITEGHFWRLFAISVLCTAPALVATMLLVAALPVGKGGGAGVLTALIWVAGSGMSMILDVAGLSVVWRNLSGRGGGAGMTGEGAENVL